MQIAYKQTLFPSDHFFTVFAFYEAACNTFGNSQTFTTATELRGATGSEMDAVVELAIKAGLDPAADEAGRAFEKLIGAKGVNQGTPKVWTSYYSQFKTLLKYNVVPIRVARFAPRFTPSHEKYLELAPSADLLSRGKADLISPKDWEREFEQDVLGRLDPATSYKALQDLGNGFDVAILCYEKPGDMCHRHYVSSWFRDNGFPVEEFPTVGDVVKETRKTLFDDIIDE